MFSTDLSLLKIHSILESNKIETNAYAIISVFFFFQPEAANQFTVLRGSSGLSSGPPGTKREQVDE